MRSALRILVVAAAFTASALLLKTDSLAHDGGNSWQRFRFPWADGQTYIVKQSVGGIVSHQQNLFYAIDWGLPYNTFVGSTGQGQVTEINSNPLSSSFGIYVVQAISTPHDGVKYVLYAHLCSAAPAVGSTLYQGGYVGRSGNTGFVLDDLGRAPSVRCSTSDNTGMHLHFSMHDGFSNGIAGTSFPFGTGVNATEHQVALHAAATSSLPLNHSTTSNNAPYGAFSDLSVDSFMRSAYESRLGLNYGSTKALDSSNFAPCSNSTRWVHGCDFSFFGFGSGLAQTFEGPSPGVQKALMRRSGFTSVFSVEGSILFAYNDWSPLLGYPLGEKAGSPVRQNFEGGFIQYTTSPCQTQVFRNSAGAFVQTYSGVCN
jgi:murein DD-endopeptidase MepM/ murein hydrolase activator NlpD